MRASISKQALRVYGQGDSELFIPVMVEESLGLERINEPVNLGIPIPAGAIFQPDDLALRNRDGEFLPVQTAALARWTDGSIKWVLLDFLASVEATEKSEYQLQYPMPSAVSVRQSGLSLNWCSDWVEVTTGHCKFVLNAHKFMPFNSVVIDSSEVLEGKDSRIVLLDEMGEEYEPKIDHMIVEADGPVRTTLKVEGKFSSWHKTALADFMARISFYAGLSLVELQFTIRNPRAAKHPGGLWDLGDEGSIYFKDLSIQMGLRAGGVVETKWTLQPRGPMTSDHYSTFEIYQDSSGGPNWMSSNHVNRFGKVMNTFQGYRVMVNGETVQEGKRTQPVVSIFKDGKSITGTLEGFWQNFPKAVGVHENRLSIGLFPRQYSDLFELQGGEQKTHTLLFEFGGIPHPTTGLEWVRDRLVPHTTPEWYASSNAFPYLLPRSQQPPGSRSLALADELVGRAVHGVNTFFDRRETIDEYGWRNFGDLYADHEAIGHKGQTPLVAHYNNQYDVIYGAIAQYLRGADPRWWRFMRDLARHVIDIDIYHTNQDRQAFNGGMFWHTNHYTDAATASHRAYSKNSVKDRGLHAYGGGPAAGHNYTSGLLHFYYLTGDENARDVVKGLADWVINMDNESRCLLDIFDRRPTGLCSSTASQDYHGPGRGPGNSINAVMDAFVMTQDAKYCAKAEELIRRCIHPNDNITERHLDDVENKWSYTVFLQSLGKYLDIKGERSEIDYTFSYARESLIHYAKWMLDNEVPYNGILERVEIPTETWPAQDIRKSIVFKFAAKYSDEPLKSVFLKKSDFFFDACMNDLLSFSTHSLTRPIVLIMTNAYIHGYFHAYPNQEVPKVGKGYEYGKPKKFKSRYHEFHLIRNTMRTNLGRVTRAWRRMVLKFI